MWLSLLLNRIGWAFFSSDSFKFYILILSLCLCLPPPRVCAPACTHKYMHVCSVSLGGQKIMSNAMGLIFHPSASSCESLHMGPGNWSQILWENNKHLLSHLISPVSFLCFFVVWRSVQNLMHALYYSVKKISPFYYMGSINSI